MISKKDLIKDLITKNLKMKVKLSQDGFGTYKKAPILKFYSMGGFWVSVFFVLSEFVLTIGFSKQKNQIHL